IQSHHFHRISQVHLSEHPPKIRVRSIELSPCLGVSASLPLSREPHPFAITLIWALRMQDWKAKKLTFFGICKNTSIKTFSSPCAVPRTTPYKPAATPSQTPPPKSPSNPADLCWINSIGTLLVFSGPRPCLKHRSAIYHALSRKSFQDTPFVQLPGKLDPHLSLIQTWCFSTSSIFKILKT
ncbi:terpenoid cyclases, partial [Striga asiatica]